MSQKADKKDCIRLAWIQITSTEWPFVPEHRFHPVRRWRFDWADVEKKIAIEIEGVSYSGPGTRHQRGIGIENDAEKYNTAVIDGWAVLRLTPRMVANDPHAIVSQIIELAVSRSEQ